MILSNYLLDLPDDIQTNIYKLQTGTAQPHIYPKSVENLKIPLPSMEQQISIIEFYESNKGKINELENEIKKLKELEKNYISNMFKLNNASLVNTKVFDKVQNEIVSIEEEVIIEPKPKVKKIVKKVKKPLIIVEEDIEV